jgi:hypothetical protein
MVADAIIDIHQAEHPMRIAEKLNCYDLYCHILREDEEAGRTDSENHGDSVAQSA